MAESERLSIASRTTAPAPFRPPGTGPPAPILHPMPVMVVGADTPVGEAIVRALVARRGEIRAFVSDPEVIASLKERRIKVAFGDLSDAGHLGAAGLNAFSAVLVASAALDGRPLSFAAGADEVYDRWAEALAEAGVRRAIWVSDPRAPGAERVLGERVTELAVVETGDRALTEVAEEVARLDEAAEL